MPPTRKYLNTKEQSGEVKLLGSLVALLLVGAILGTLIWINVEIWPAIFD